MREKQHQVAKSRATCSLSDHGKQLSVARSRLLVVAVPRDYKGCITRLYIQSEFRCEPPPRPVTSVSTIQYWTRKPGESHWHRKPPGIQSESDPYGGTNHSSPIHPRCFLAREKRATTPPHRGMWWKAIMRFRKAVNVWIDRALVNKSARLSCVSTCTTATRPESRKQRTHSNRASI